MRVDFGVQDGVPNHDWQERVDWVKVYLYSSSLYQQQRSPKSLRRL